MQEVQGNWLRELWDVVKTARNDNQEWGSPSVEEVNLNKGMMDVNMQSMYGDQGPEKSEDSRQQILMHLPSST
ncbi:hypothetical protein GOP47_0002482 [Adiantum capillus-veneris]|uniref:Uncharacterized protein n=1 Tax=Adiantum capillus-veneris TaxID=13818 RepID=A0A9D4VAG0_ADICA|nr:hypothetical protein GOP47_0002482 [Adiantum capillus-veneris]